jgi:hypothetical protein
MSVLPIQRFRSREVKLRVERRIVQQKGREVVVVDSRRMGKYEWRTI